MDYDDDNGGRCMRECATGDHYRVSDVDAEMERRDAMIRELADQLCSMPHEWDCDYLRHGGECSCGLVATIDSARALAEGKG